MEHSNTLYRRGIFAICCPVAWLAVSLFVTMGMATPALTKEPTPLELLTGGKYMSPAGGCQDVTADLLGWPAKSLMQCNYEVEDHLANGSKRKRQGFVVLANPPPERALTWVASACAMAAPKAQQECVQTTAADILGASGTQFPVAGLVWEDLYCGNNGKCVYDKHGNEAGDGVHEGYVFRNGVTVRVHGYRNGTETPASDLEALAFSQVVDGIASGYARVSSTSREDFRTYTKRDDIPSGHSDDDAVAWSDIVGSVFRAALDSDRNPLIEASVCARYGFPKTCKP